MPVQIGVGAAGAMEIHGCGKTVAHHQQAAVGRPVQEDTDASHGQNRAHLAGQGDRLDRGVHAGIGATKLDLAAIRGPVKPQPVEQGRAGEMQNVANL